MKKIGIITSSYARAGTYGCNYGAALQGYALVKKLRDLGYSAYDVNYLSDNEYHPQSYGIIKRTLKRIRMLFDFRLVKAKLHQLKNRKNEQKNIKAFQQFVFDYDLTYQKGKFFSFDDLQKLEDDFYAFIVGSDVVWNPCLHNNVNDLGFFLAFTKEGVKRIAYAPSFGITELPGCCKNDLKDLLVGFKAISVREESGAKLIKKEADMEVPVVLDPTLLLSKEEYEQVAVIPANLPKKYLLVYKFGDLKYVDDHIDYLSKKYNLPIVFVPSNYKTKYAPRYDFGPREFLGAIQNARLVISDSFHCTIFCLINHIPFLTFYRTMPQPGKDINSRMIDLLKLVNMESRLISPTDTIKEDELFCLDFNGADEIIQNKKKDSEIYLKNALGDYS